MWQRLIKLDTEQKQLSSWRFNDIFSLDVCANTNFIKSLNNHPSIIKLLISVISSKLKLRQTGCLSIMTFNQTSKSAWIHQILIKIGQYPLIHRQNQIAMVLHPLQQNSFSDRIAIWLLHSVVDLIFIWRHTRQRLEVFRCNSVQVVNAKDLVENSDPTFHSDEWENFVYYFWFHVFFTRIHFKEFCVVCGVKQIFGADCV